jgi:hypothetical protein
MAVGAEVDGARIEALGGHEVAAASVWQRRLCTETAITRADRR